MNEVFEFLKSCKIYYIGTINGDKPSLRPFTSLNLYQGKIYIQTGKVKAVAHQMKANPNIVICAMSGGSWIRLNGEVVLDESAEAQQSMFDANPGLDKMYAVNDGNNEVYYIQNVTADIYGAPGSEPKHFEF